MNPIESWISKIWFVEWWSITTTWQAKMYVVQSIVIKIAALCALGATLWLSLYVLVEAIQIVPFRIWRNSMSQTTNLTWPAVALAVLTISVFLMAKLDA